MRWDKLTSRRQKDLVNSLEQIDISYEDDERMAEHHFFRAQCYAHINCFGHPNPDNPPFIKDKKMSITLSDTTPFGTKQRRGSVLETACLFAKTTMMMNYLKMELSTSSFASSPYLVPLSKKIAEFMSKYKDEAISMLYKEEHRELIASLYRMTIDYRKLNSQSFLEQWPLPRILDLLDKASGKERYSSMDLPDAFHSIYLTEDSRPCTAILTPTRLLQYCCMPQGHKNSANVWSRIISEVFSPLKYEPLIVYQDDQINHEQDLIKHLLLQGKVYDILEEYNMIHKWQKTNLNYRTMKILGHVLSIEGRGPDPGLVRTINDLARPRTLTDLRCFLGLCRVAQEYISDLAGILSPMSDLTKKGKNVDLDWGQEQQDAFEKIKILMTSKPVLMEPSYKKQFRIHCDACRVGHGVGAVLLQKNEDDKWQIVAYWSRGLEMAERHMSATMLECIALHDAIVHWGHFLQNGIIFQVVTDHYALVYLVTKVGASSCNNLRLQNYCLDVQKFHFELFHRAGKIHYDADAVSRLLHTGEEPYFNKADDIRDDFGPLTEEEKAYFVKQYDIQNSTLIIEAINNHRLEREKSLIVNPVIEKKEVPAISAQRLEAEVINMRVALVEKDDIEKIRRKENYGQIENILSIQVGIPERVEVSEDEREWKQYPTDELTRLWSKIASLYKRWRVMKEFSVKNLLLQRILKIQYGVTKNGRRKRLQKIIIVFSHHYLYKCMVLRIDITNLENYV